MSNARHVVFAIVGMVFCLLVLETIPIDIRLQGLFYEFAEQRWMWSGSEPVARFVFYDGVKALLVLFALCLLVAAVVVRKSSRFAGYQKGIWIVFISLMLVPASVSVLKAATDVACPKQLTQFGGGTQYIGIVKSILDRHSRRVINRCFPAGHASGGFALMSLAFLFRKERNQKHGFWIGMALGWVMGAYKMIIGDHFLSHAVFTMLIAWAIINLTAISIGYRRPNWCLSARAITRFSAV